MKIKILDKAKKKKFISRVGDFGIGKIPQLLIRMGKEKINAYSGNLSKEEIMDFWRLFPVEGIGLYVGKDVINRDGAKETRLSLEGLNVWKEQITRRVFILTKKQEEEWFAGKEIELEDSQIGKINGGLVAVKSADGKDFIGTGKIGNAGKTLTGFLAKERRRKSQNI